MPFDNMTEEDAYWATRIVLSFTEPELRAIVNTAQYSNPRDADYVLRILLERRAIAARYWLRHGDALAAFSIQPATEGVVLKFRDLLLDNNLAGADPVSYTYQVRGRRYQSQKASSSVPMMVINRSTLGAAIENADAGAPVEVVIWTRRGAVTSDSVRVSFDWDAGRETFSIRGISRG
jgi:hypothetical protein